jgi:hypothetical protein
MFVKFLKWKKPSAMFLGKRILKIFEGFGEGDLCVSRSPCALVLGEAGKFICWSRIGFSAIEEQQGEPLNLLIFLVHPHLRVRRKF